MNIVIVGGGEVGFSVARSLSQDGHDIVLVEVDADRAAKAENELDVMVVRGNGARPNVLAKAGIEEGTSVELMLALSGKDEVNILACWIAKKMGVKQVIARAVGMEFTDSGSWSKELGIDKMVSPERSVAREVVSLIETRGAVMSYEIDDKAGIYAFRTEEGCPVCGLSLMDMRAKNPSLITIIVFIQRGDEGFIPKASDVLQAGDVCYSFCYIEQIHEIASLYQSSKKKRRRRTMIVGAGKVGFQTAQTMLERRKNAEIKLIELDKAKGTKVASELPQAMVLWGDGADEDMLVEEGVAQTGGFLAATNDDESNLVLASLAKSLGAAKSIAVVRRRSYMKLASHLPIDAIINRNEALSSAIISSVRHPDRSNTLMIFDQIGAETLRITILADSPAIGVKLMDLAMPRGSLVGLVRRVGAKQDLFIPTGTFEFQEGDSAIIFAEQNAVDAVMSKLGAREG